MFKLLKDIVDLAGTASKIVTEPARIVVNGVSQVVKPVTDALEEVADDLKDDR